MTSTDAVMAEAPKRRLTKRGYLVTMGTVLALAAGLGFTVLGLGAADQAVASFDAASWVWSRDKGEVARLNGVTAKVDTRVDIGQARGHQLQVSQSDRFVILRDVNTGAIASMDLTALQSYWNGSSAAGIGVSVALHEDSAFVIDAVQGKVQQVDPASLQAIGEALRFPPGISGGHFDDQGRLWIAVPSEGTVTAITPAPPASDSGGSGAGAGSPQRVRTEAVAPPSHDLALGTLTGGVAVLDRTTNALTTIGEGAPRATTLPLPGLGVLPARTEGTVVPVTVPDARKVYAVDTASGRSTEFVVPGEGAEVQAAVAWEGFVYVAEKAGGRVHVFDRDGRSREPISIPRSGGPLELEVRENYLFINAPGGATARVVDDKHTVRAVDKYADDVLGGDPPPAVPQPPKRQPPKTKPKPAKPTPAKPGPPRSVRAAAGNAEARVTWQAAAANNAPILRYVVTGGGRTFQVGAEQRSLTVTGLTNGETYEFSVHAVNKVGDGPARASNPVKPTAEVPDPPGAPTAEAKPDGSVTVSWPAANGQGLAIARYTVTAVAEGGSAPVGDVAETSLTIPAGQLDYGKQYAFTVVAVNERGAGSPASPVGNSVVPFTKPGKPGDVAASTVADQNGAIRVTWQAAADNGRAVSRYVVKAGGKSVDVPGGTSTTVTGLDTGATVSVEVRAVNEAGESEPGIASARTVAKPVVTITGVDPSFNAATVTFSVNAGGGQATCTLTVSDGGKGSNGSCSSLKASGLKPSTAYTFTVTAKNAAGEASKAQNKSTDALYGVATCNNGTGDDQKTYCNKDVDGRNGNEIFAGTSQQGTQVGWAKPGTRLQAYCKKNGEEVYAYVYNDHKKSTWWIQVNYEGKNYIPWAWLNLDGGDDLNNLPTC